VKLAGSGFSLSELTIEKSIKNADYSQEGSAHSRGSSFEAFYARWRRHAPAICGKELDSMGKDQMGRLFMDIGSRVALYKLLDKAASNPRITAWIMAFDYVADMAMDYCHEKGISVPGTVAIAGFDDQIAASISRITSYNYNYPAVASAILHFLLRPAAGFWTQRRVMEIAGKIVERESG
jgi:DNA-binding LacI/PurR family transcriptional regulator